MNIAHATVRVKAPASKSMSHRAVIAAALAGGRSELTGVLDSVDLERTMGCLRACGAVIERRGDVVVVDGVAGRPMGGKDEPADLNVHESGTTCRLMTGVVAAGDGRFRIHGAPRMHERPIGALASVLEDLGAGFAWEGKKGYPPFVLAASGIPGGEVLVDAGESSQYISGVLLACACGRSETIVGLGGAKVVSWPYVALTLQIMDDFGVPVRVQIAQGDGWIDADWRDMDEAAPGRVRFVVSPGSYRAQDYDVEGDWSNASYFLAAGAVGPHPVAVSGLRMDSLQGDRAMLDILGFMGARITWQADGVLVAPPVTGCLRGVEVDMSSCPDIVPTVAVVAAQAATRTVITGAAHLRIKECDRLDATATQLRKVGARVAVTSDGLIIDPAAITPGPVDFETYGDHRIPMSLSVLELAGVRPTFDNPGCVSKSFPGFWDEWAKVHPRR
ncbi:3-phosphoshikimate 1-carboxyvinyltransferase [Desulfobaculum xiamenense]|uniref:3-phosphoshikimate 1-carboxyvinyltransferase n=1 Tax=Desulfobaculum xiamenense TaxID=995050 RepID=A0A846QJD6_9BACT|nr:3-phosphoshikimate 1-carboxyvinyltransferase [Desulfobaculum xiamenense]NJB68261.1 3-phosphoshikimate 1-carboxyvinyltransferase [Desulfobaculum xiamenense]